MVVAQFVKPFLGGKYPAHALSNSKLQHSCKFKTCKFRTCYANPESGLHGRTGLRSNVFLRLSQVINKGRSKGDRSRDSLKMNIQKHRLLFN